jgi:non-specific serine/threonine protein kinase
MAALQSLLDQDRVRLVTLTGPGGCGKTRLALEVVTALEDRFDRAWFVDLTTIATADLVPSAVAQAIGVQESGSRELRAIVREMLSVGRFLLVLDNFEHVLDGGAYVASLVAACRDLVVLATSREALAVRAERVFPVEPLATPRRDQLDDVAALRRFASVELFDERAHAARHDFTMSDADVPVVAEICLDLDGLPLAIELVAAQTSVLSPREILTRLSTRAPLVTSGPRDLPARHRTLDATVDWSYSLLTPPEQAVFRLAGVFAGSFDGQTASAVAAELGVPTDALATLAALVTKSLVRSTSAPDRSTRFWMLDTIRSFAHDRLRETGELAAAERAHASYYVTLAEQLQLALRGPGMADALDTLSLDYANFRAVFQWSATHDELEVGLRLAGALYLFWNARGHLAEARAWLDMALPRSAHVPAEIRAVALNAAGVMAGMQHDHARAIDYFSRSLELWTALGNISRAATASNNLGLVAQNLGDLDLAEARFKQAQALYARVDDRLGQANAIGSRARIARDRGELASALELFNDCLLLFREVGHQWGIANVLANLGHVRLASGDVAGSKGAFRDSLTIRLELGNVLHIAESLEGVAAVTATEQPRLAVRLLGAAEMMRDTTGAPVPAIEKARHGEIVARVRARLSTVMFRAGWNAGRALSTRGAVDLAMRDELLPPEPDAAASDLDALSERERDIARLIARGLSNREIAAELVVSVKTVETHIKHIFTKLNVRNRAGVAVLASRSEALQAREDVGGHP